MLSHAVRFFPVRLLTKSIVISLANGDMCVPHNIIWITKRTIPVIIFDERAMEKKLKREKNGKWCVNLKKLHIFMYNLDFSPLANAAERATETEK